MISPLSSAQSYAIKPQFGYVKSFSEGLAAVEVNGNWGYIANPLAK